MKAWQIFAIGIAALVAALLLRVYESAIAGVGALLIVVVVVAGFAARPRRDVFYIQTTVFPSDPDYAVSVEHSRIAVRVELARLWLLFVPTFGALGFLVVTFAKGITWKFSLWDSSFSTWMFFDGGPYPVVLMARVLFLIVFGLLSTWLSERWVLRDANACSAGYVSFLAGRVLYSFKDPGGEYYGGDGIFFSVPRPSELATLVVYNIAKPHLNKIAMSLLFHRFVIVGRGLTDLDAETAAASSLTVQPAPQSL